MNQSGFTLIEIMVVIAIIGLLAAVSIGYLSGVQKRGQQASAQNQGQIVALAVNEWLTQSPIRTVNTLSGQDCTRPLTLTATGFTEGYVPGSVGWNSPQTKMTCVVSGEGRSFQVTTAAADATFVAGN